MSKVHADSDKIHGFVSTCKTIFDGINNNAESLSKAGDELGNYWKDPAYQTFYNHFRDNIKNIQLYLIAIEEIRFQLEEKARLIDEYCAISLEQVDL